MFEKKNKLVFLEHQLLFFVYFYKFVYIPFYTLFKFIYFILNALTLIEKVYILTKVD